MQDRPDQPVPTVGKVCCTYLPREAFERDDVDQEVFIRTPRVWPHGTGYTSGKTGNRSITVLCLWVTTRPHLTFCGKAVASVREIGTDCQPTAETPPPPQDTFSLQPESAVFDLVLSWRLLLDFFTPDLEARGSGDLPLLRLPITTRLLSQVPTYL